MNTIRTISTMIFPLITFPYTSRILGPEGTGKVNFATSFVSYFILLASIGIPLYGIREIARVRDDKKKLSELTQELFVMQLMTSIIIFLIFIVLISINGKLADEKTLFFIVSFSIILTTLGMDWLYQGLEQYSYITIRSIVFSSLSTIAIFVFINNKEDYLISAAIGVFAALGSSVLNFYNARKILFVKRTHPWNFKRHIKPMAMVYFLNFIISIYVQLDTVMLGFMSSAKNVGYYTSAIKLTRMILGIITSLGGVLLPRLSYYIANGQTLEFNRLISKSLDIILLLCLPAIIGLMMLSNELILVFAGNLYLPAANAMIITAPIILFIGLSSVFGLQILYPLGKEKIVIIANIAGAISSIILNLILIPRYTYLGASISTLVSEFFVVLVMLFILLKVYPISYSFKNAIKYLFAAVVLVVTLLIVRMEIEILWLRLIVAISSGIFVYLVTLIVSNEPFVLESILKLKQILNHK